MKQKFFLLILVAFLSSFFFSCQENNFSAPPTHNAISSSSTKPMRINNAESIKQETKILEYAQNISTEHNLMLTYLSDYIYKEQETIIAMKTPNELECLITKALDNYIEKNKNKYPIYEDLKDCYYQIPSNVTGNDIEQMFSEKALETVSIVMKNILDTKLHEKIIKEVAQSPNTYSLKEQYALCALIATLDSSIQYWKNYDQTKISFIPNHLTIYNNYTKKIDQYIDYGGIAINNGLRILDVEVVIADAYWGWFGTVASCGNLVVGGGAAAAASFFKILEINNL